MKTMRLPRQWRREVQQALEAQNITLELQQITDIKRGKSSDEALTEKVMGLVRGISRRHARKLKKIQRLTAPKNNN